MVLICRFYIRKTMDQISDILEDCLIGKLDAVKEMKETRESKIAVQLRTILERVEYEKGQSKEEKEKITALISDLSHQLKTPLSNLSMYVELLEGEELSRKEQEEFTKKIREQQNKMEWLTKMLVQISRLEVGILEFKTTATELKETLAQSVSMVYKEIVEKNIQVKMGEFEDCKLIHNRKWTKEVFANILENAIKYSEENSKIAIRVIPMELYTKIMITDEGIGIPEKEYNEIFKRFYRGEQVQEKEGMGLGLYLAQLILAKEGGYVTVDSVIGRGSTFSVFLQNEK